MLTALLWYLVGLSTFPLIELLSSKKDNKSKLESRKWDKIETIKYSTEFDHEFTAQVGPPEVAAIVGYGLAKFVAVKSKTLDFSITPGKYSMKMEVFVRFIKRS